jgi:hypothetical protein
MEKPIIRLGLSWSRNLGLILLRESGVIIHNQTNGYACNQSEAEGIYVLLQDEPQEIEEFFANYGNIDNAAADFLDEYFQRDEPICSLHFLKVDRARLNESHEAWVYVKVAQPSRTPGFTIIERFGETEGILTWLNSD